MRTPGLGLWLATAQARLVWRMLESHPQPDTPRNTSCSQLSQPAGANRMDARSRRSQSRVAPPHTRLTRLLRGLQGVCPARPPSATRGCKISSAGGPFSTRAGGGALWQPPRRSRLCGDESEPFHVTVRRTSFWMKPNTGSTGMHTASPLLSLSRLPHLSRQPICAQPCESSMA